MGETTKSLREKLARANARLQKGKKAATEMVGTLLNTAEVVGTGFGFSYARERFGEVPENGNGGVELTIAGIPVSLAAGLTGHLLSFAGFFGKQSDHVHAISNGALADYTCHIGTRLGREAAQEAALTQGYRRRAVGSRGGVQRGLGRGSFQAWGNPTMFSRAAGGRGQ